MLGASAATRLTSGSQLKALCASRAQELSDADANDDDDDVDVSTEKKRLTSEHNYADNLSAAASSGGRSAGKTLRPPQKC